MEKSWQQMPFGVIPIFPAFWNCFYDIYVTSNQIINKVDWMCFSIFVNHMVLIKIGQVAVET